MARPTPLPLSPGDRLGRYRLVQSLGRGGMGEVWEATLFGPAGFRKAVALKVLHTERADAASEEALVQEARLGALVAHPNVVSTYELLREGERWVVAMELVRGTTVAALLRGGPLPPHAVLDLGLQLSVALAHIHGVGAGIVHRDIKPANLLVDRAGLLKVADLGLASLTGSLVQGAGTPGYLAPEQIDGRVTARTDLFAVGATLFRCATGERPLGRGQQALRNTHRVEYLLDQPDFLARADTAVPGLGGVIRTCMRHDPAARWRSAAALRHALSGLVAESPGAGLAALVADPGGLVATTPSSPGSSGPSSPHAATARDRRLGAIPLPRNAFVGRSKERSRLQEAVRTRRLVTVVGPAGAGKTRLSQEVARAEPRAVVAWLAGISSEAAVCRAVAAALEVPLLDADPIQQLGRVLDAWGDGLLVLDDAEQAVAAVAGLTARWQGLAPRVRLLVTSRVALSVSGEHRIELPPLPTEDAVSLFLERSPRAVGIDELPAVRALVLELDGLPLAVELAAGRTAGLRVDQLLERVEDRFRLLRAADPEGSGRHVTLQAALDTSWELLEPAEQQALAQLSVFVGPFSLDEAEAVVAVDDPTAPWTLDLLTRLTEHSWVQVDGDAERMRLLRSIRAYGARHLGDSGAAEARHGEVLARSGTPMALDALIGPEGLERLASLRGQILDLDAAVQRARARADPEVAEAAALCLGEALLEVGPLSAVEALCAALLEGDTSPRRATELRLLRARARVPGGNLEGAVADLDAGLQAAHEPLLALRVRMHRMALHSRLGTRDVAADLGAVVAELRAAGHERWAARALAEEGLHHLRYMEAERGEALVTRALSEHRRLGDRRAEVRIGVQVAWALSLTDRAPESRQTFEAGLALAEDLGIATLQAVYRGNLGTLALKLGQPREARTYLESAIALDARLGQRQLEGSWTGNLALVALMEGDTVEAMALNERARALRQGRRPQLNLWLDAAKIRRDAGDVAGARAAFDEASVLAEGFADSPFLERLRAEHVHLAVAEGDVAEARRRVDRLLEVGTGPQGAIALAEARVLVAEGRHDEARRAIAQTQALADDAGLSDHALLVQDLGAMLRRLDAG